MFALLLVASFLWLRHEPGDGAARNSSESAAQREEAGASSANANAAESDTASEARAGLAEGTPSETTSAAPTQKPGVELVAVFGAHRRRVEPVELWWWAPRDSESWGELGSIERWLESGEIDARIAELAQPLVPDAKGAFHAPAPMSVGCVIARGEKLWGWTHVLRSSPDPTYIELESDESLRALVLDAAGAPAPNARVALRQRWPARDGAPETHDLAMVMTGADGVAQFPHFRAQMEGAWDFDAEHVLAVAEPFAEPVESPFDPTRPPVETVELRLPPCGSVLLDVVGDARGAQHSLALARSSSSDDALPTSNLDFLRPSKDGVAHFPFVGLGGVVTPVSVYEGRVTVHEASAALGPTRPGEVVRIGVEVLAQAKPERRIVGTLAGPAIHSSGSTRVDIELRSQDASGDPWSQNLRVIVLPDGDFLIPLLREAVGSTTLEFTALGPRDERVGQAELTVRSPAGVSVLELGQIFIDARTLLVTGRVVDSSGRQVVGARVLGWGARGVGANLQNRDWQHFDELETHTGPTGEFELRGDSLWTALGLSAWTSDAASEFRVFDVGARDVVLTLASDGAIAGSISLDAGLAREYMNMGVFPEGPSAAPHGAMPYRRSEIDAEGAFVVRGLAPGSYTVAAYASGTPREVARVEGVLVEAGRTTRDPRLEPLDIGEWSELRVLDADGRAACEAVAYRVESDSRRWIPQSLPGGKLMVEHSNDPLWIVAPEHLIARFDPASRAPFLQLQRAARVQVQVAQELLDALGDAELVLTLHSYELPRAVARSNTARISIDAVLSPEVALCHRGPYATSLTVIGLRSVELPHVLLGTVRPASRDLPQILELRWSPADLIAALEQIR